MRGAEKKLSGTGRGGGHDTLDERAALRTSRAAEVLGSHPFESPRTACHTSPGLFERPPARLTPLLHNLQSGG